MVRKHLAVGAARMAGRLSRRFTKGDATSLPGLVGLRLDPGLIRKLSRDLAGSVVVTGTNGKTTTSRFIGSLLATAGKPYLHNQAGSNLERGIASVLALHRGKRGKRPWGLFEVDEATVPSACVQLKPKLVVVTNLFRDQLDRYGELERTADYLREGLRTLPKTSTVLLNADDPLVGSLGKGLKATVRYFGIEDTSVSKRGLPHAADSITSPTGKLLRYEAVFIGHLGHYRSPDKSLHRPKPQVAITGIKLDGMSGSRLKLKISRRRLELKLNLPGLYNVYNALAAVAAGHELGVATDKIAPAIERTAAAFGRTERVKVDGHQLIISLIKNPTGANEVIHTLSLDRRPKDVLILINDKFADGTDVSWLWDTDFEALLPGVRSVAVGGLRADDMALRLKYAGLPESEVGVHPSIERAVAESLKRLPEDRTLFVLPTYTAMLELRHVLTQSGHLTHYLH